MPLGRKPKPTALKKLEGNRGKRKLNDAEPQPPVAIPDCPAHIQSAARDEWSRITKALFRLGLITELDHAALEAHCFAYGQWVEAAKKVIERGAILDPDRSAPAQLEFGKKPDDAGTQVVNWNPWVFHANKSMAQFLKSGIEFGLTPSSRSRLHGTTPEDEDGSEAFLFGEAESEAETSKPN